MIEVIALLLGIVVLAKASDLCVENSVKLSNMLGISETVIGFILIAIATSLPELLITIFASLRNATSLTLGTLIGSNIADMYLVFALPALVMSYRFLQQDLEQVHYVITVTSIAMLFALILKRISLGFGVFLVLLFFLANLTIIKTSFKERVSSNILEIIKTFFITLFAIFIVILSAYITTESSIAIAKSYGISEIVIGFTLLAVGSSLPEIAVGIAAIKRGNYGLAIGDTIGSLLTNLTLVLGIGSILQPIVIDFVSMIAIVLLIATSFIFLQIVERKNIGRREALVMLLVYAIATLILIQASLGS